MKTLEQYKAEGITINQASCPDCDHYYPCPEDYDYEMTCPECGCECVSDIDAGDDGAAGLFFIRKNAGSMAYARILTEWIQKRTGNKDLLVCTDGAGGAFVDRIEAPFFAEAIKDLCIVLGAGSCEEYDGFVRFNNCKNNTELLNKVITNGGEA